MNRPYVICHILSSLDGKINGPFMAADAVRPYFVALDTRGELGWESGRFANKGRAEAHVIEILTEAAPLSYRAYLRKRGVSYIIAGKKSWTAAWP